MNERRVGKCPRSIAWLVAGSLLLAGSVARAQPSSKQADKEQMQARYQVFVMESVLERAVQHGAQMLSQQVQAVMPDMVLLAGAPKARGFRLDGYGVFFDVEVPALRRSMAWTFRMLEQNDTGLTTAFQVLRRHLQTLQDARARQDLEQALNRVELRVGPMVPPAANTGGGRAASTSAGSVASAAAPALVDDAEARPETGRSHLLQDPGEAYTAEVKKALIDVMLDHSGPIDVGPDEWLTIAARDHEDRTLTPGDPYEVATVVLRVRGEDLAAFRAGRLGREEARHRVEVREF